MQFSSIIGQQAIKNKLIQSVKENRVSHAQLFLGNSGSGNLALAFAYAQYICCEKNGERRIENGDFFSSNSEPSTPNFPEDSCGQCPSCIKAQKLIHPDIHFSYPVVAAKSGDKPKSTDYLSKWREAFLENPYMNVNQWLQYIEAENRQGNITVEECHEIIRKLNLKTFEAKYKVLIMWMPEYLGGTGNTLLKLLEEPPDNTLILLVAENRDLILNTILSRCQLLKIGQLEDEQIQQVLIEKVQLPAEEAKRIAFMADGDLNEALQLAKNSENDNSMLFQQWMESFLNNQGNRLVQWVDEIVKTGRENQKNFLRYALHFLREYLMLDFKTEKQIRLQEGELNFAKKIKEQLDIEQAEKIIELLNKNHYYIERNAHSKILFMNLSLSISKVLQNKDVTL